MPIGLVGHQSGSTGATGIAASTVINYAFGSTGEAGYAAAQPSVGDYVIVEVADASTLDRLASVTGFTLIGTRQYQNDTADVAVSVWAKFLASGETTSFEITTGGTTASTHARSYHVRAYRGVHTTTPQDVAAVLSGKINGALPDPAAITPVTAGARIVALAGGALAVTGITAGYTQSGLSNFSSQGGGSSAAYSAIAGGGDFAWVSGAYNPAAWSHTRGANNADSCAWATLALRPAPPTGGSGSGGVTAPKPTVSGTGEKGPTPPPESWVAFDGNDSLTGFGLPTNATSVRFKARLLWRGLPGVSTYVYQHLFTSRGTAAGDIFELRTTNGAQFRFWVSLLDTWGDGADPVGPTIVVGQAYDLDIWMDTGGNVGSAASGVKVRFQIDGVTVYSSTGDLPAINLAGLGVLGSNTERLQGEAESVFLAVNGTTILDIDSQPASVWNANPYMVGTVTQASGGTTGGSGSGAVTAPAKTVSGTGRKNAFSTSGAAIGPVPTVSGTGTKGSAAPVWNDVTQVANGDYVTGGRTWKFNTAIKSWAIRSLQGDADWHRFEVRDEDNRSPDDMDRHRSELSGSGFPFTQTSPTPTELWVHQWIAPETMPGAWWVSLFQLFGTDAVSGFPNPYVKLEDRENTDLEVNIAGTMTSGRTQIAAWHGPLFADGQRYSLVWCIVMHGQYGDIRLWVNGTLCLDLKNHPIGVGSTPTAYLKYGIYADEVSTSGGDGTSVVFPTHAVIFGPMEIATGTDALQARIATPMAVPSSIAAAYPLPGASYPAGTKLLTDGAEPGGANLFDTYTPTLESNDGTGTYTYDTSTDTLVLQGTGASYGARAIWGIPTIAGRTYTVTGALSGSSMNWRVGTTSGGSEIQASTTLATGAVSFSWLGDGSTHYLMLNRQSAVSPATFAGMNLAQSAGAGGGSGSGAVTAPVALASGTGIKRGVSTSGAATAPKATVASTGGRKNAFSSSGAAVAAKATVASPGGVRSGAGSGAVTAAKATVASTGGRKNATSTSAAVTAPKATATSTGGRKNAFSQSAQVTGPKPTVSGTGGKTLAGNGAVQSPKPTVSGTGRKNSVSVSAGVIAPKANVTSTGGRKNTFGAGSVTARPATATGAGLRSGTGTGAVTAPKASVGGSGAISRVGSGAVVAPKPQVTGSGPGAHRGSGAVVAPLPQVSGTGQRNQFAAGTGNAVGPKPTVSGFGVKSTAGTGAVLAPKATVAGTGRKAANGNGAVIALKPTATGAGIKRGWGSGGVNAPKAQAAGTGVRNGVPISGEGGVIAPKPIVAGTGVKRGLGAGAATAPKPLASGTGHKGALGLGAVVGPKPTVAGTGGAHRGGAGAVLGPRPVVAGYGVKGAFGAGAVVAPLPTVWGRQLYYPAGPETMTKLDALNRVFTVRRINQVTTSREGPRVIKLKPERRVK